MSATMGHPSAALADRYPLEHHPKVPGKVLRPELAAVLGIVMLASVACTGTGSVVADATRPRPGDVRMSHPALVAENPADN